VIAVPERFGRSLRVAGDERELNDVVIVPFDLCPWLSLLDLDSTSPSNCFFSYM
jgi:hypothetical protein